MIMKSKWNLSKDEGACSSTFYQDLFEGGHYPPEDILNEPDSTQVLDAMRVINEYKKACLEANIIVRL